jgi:hypothetical protein
MSRRIRQRDHFCETLADLMLYHRAGLPFIEGMSFASIMRIIHRIADVTPPQVMERFSYELATRGRPLGSGSEDRFIYELDVDIHHIFQDNKDILGSFNGEMRHYAMVLSGIIVQDDLAAHP